RRLPRRRAASASCRLTARVHTDRLRDPRAAEPHAGVVVRVGWGVPGDDGARREVLDGGEAACLSVDVFDPAARTARGAREDPEQILEVVAALHVDADVATTQVLHGLGGPSIRRDLVRIRRGELEVAAAVMPDAAGTDERSMGIP